MVASPMEYFVIVECTPADTDGEIFRDEFIVHTIEQGKHRIGEHMLNHWDAPLRMLYQMFGNDMVDRYTDSIFDTNKAQLNISPQYWPEDEPYQWPTIRAWMYRLTGSHDGIDQMDTVELNMQEIWKTAKQRFVDQHPN